MDGVPEGVLFLLYGADGLAGGVLCDLSIN